MKKKFLLGSASLLAAVALAACSSDNVLTSNAGNITKDEFYQELVKTSGEEVLQRITFTKVLENAVPNKTEIKQKVDAQVATTVTQAGGEAQFQAAVNTTVEDYKNRVYLSELLTAVIEAKTPVTDEELAAFYETWHPNVSASHILVTDEATAQDIIAQLNAGGDWNALAAEHSIDQSSGANGGALGEFGPGRMVVEFEQAAFQLKTGEITQTPVQTQFGYHIIKMDSNPGKTTLDADKEAVKKAFLADKTQDATFVNNLISTLLKEANISISEEKLKDTFKQFLETTNVNATESSQQ